MPGDNGMMLRTLSLTLALNQLDSFISREAPAWQDAAWDEYVKIKRAIKALRELAPSPD